MKSILFYIFFLITLVSTAQRNQLSFTTSALDATANRFAAWNSSGDAALGTVANGLTLSAGGLSLGGALTGNTTLSGDFTLSLSGGATNPGLNVGSIAGDPSSLTNGAVWYNSSLGALRARIGGSSVSLGSGTIGGTIAATQVGYGSGANTLTSEAAFNYDATNNVLGVDNVGRTTAGTFDLFASNGNVQISGTNCSAVFANDTDVLFNNGGIIRLSSAPVNNNALTQIIGRNSGTGNLEYKDASSFTGTPGGANTQIQFNNSGAFGGDADLTFTAGNLLTATNTTVTTNLINSALTSGRLPVISTAGLFVDDADLTYSTVGNSLTIGVSGAARSVFTPGNIQFTGSDNVLGGDITAPGGGDLQIIGNDDVILTPDGANGNIEIQTGVYNDASGVKHARITTGSIAGTSSASVTLTWTTPFADTNYTPIATLEDGSTNPLGLRLVRIVSHDATTVVMLVENTAVGALTGDLHVIAMHD